jgi:hypothetical protein
LRSLNHFAASAPHSLGDAPGNEVGAAQREAVERDLATGIDGLVTARW